MKKEAKRVCGVCVCTQMPMQIGREVRDLFSPQFYRINIHRRNSLLDALTANISCFLYFFFFLVPYNFVLFQFNSFCRFRVFPPLI